MNWRWLALDYVDPDLPLTPAQRRRVWSAAKSVAAKDLRWFGGRRNSSTSAAKRQRNLAFAQAAIPGVALGGSQILVMYFFPGMIVAAALNLVISAVFMWMAMTFVGQWVWKPHVNKALRQMGYDVCVRCGYWLRGLDSSIIKCPECGCDRVALPPHPPGLDQRSH